MKSLVLLLLSLTALTSHGADKSLSLTTPRGAPIRLDIYNPGAPRSLLLAPGQGCNPRLDMYGAIADAARANGLTVVRLYWAYCLTTPEGKPAADLAAEKEDFQTVLQHARQTLGYKDDQISVGGKSMGTLVTFEAFLAQKQLKALVLLTPLCTDEGATPSERKNVFNEVYPGLAADSRRILLAQGNADPLCDTAHFQDYLKPRPNNFVPLVVKGDHGFRVLDGDGKENKPLGALNLMTVAQWLSIWLN